MSYQGISAANPQISSVSQIQSSESSVYHGLADLCAAEPDARLHLPRLLRLVEGRCRARIWTRPATTGNSTGTEPEDNRNKFLDRQRSDYDQRHVATMSIVYKSNYNLHNFIARNVANGWTVTSIIRIQSGNPFNITTGADTNQDGVTNDRPNAVPGVIPRITQNGGSRVAMEANWVSKNQYCLYNSTVTNPDGSITPACPQAGAGPAGSDGTVRQNSLDAPGRRSIDASIFRDFQITERVKFQIRGESTNVFNLTNLPAPVSTLSATNFGQIIAGISGGSFGNRVIQVGGRILF